MIIKPFIYKSMQYHSSAGSAYIASVNNDNVFAVFIDLSSISARIDGAVSKHLCNRFISRAVCVTRAMFSLSLVYIDEDKLNKNTMNNLHLFRLTRRKFIWIAPHVPDGVLRTGRNM